jgi:O-antigen/teichoic acid export membrane protein
VNTDEFFIHQPFAGVGRFVAAFQHRHQQLRPEGLPLLAGQFTNLIKNNLLSLETLLLGRLVAAEGVAVFRVARSLVNLSTVLLNISYQRSFRALAAEKDDARRGPILRRMSGSAVKLWAASVPPVLVAAIAFAWLKPEGYADLTWLTALAALAALPVALKRLRMLSSAISNWVVLDF